MTNRTDDVVNAVAKELRLPAGHSRRCFVRPVQHGLLEGTAVNVRRRVLRTRREAIKEVVPYSLDLYTDVGAGFRCVCHECITGTRCRNGESLRFTCDTFVKSSARANVTKQQFVAEKQQ